MNSTLMIHFFYFIRIIGRNVSCGSIMVIQLAFIIRCNLIVWYLSMIIIGDNGCFLIITTPFFIVFTRAVWLMIYQYSQKISNNNIVRNKLNAWYIFNFTYYWPSCQKTMYLPIDKWFLFNTGLVPIISIQSSSTSEILPYLLLLL